VILVNLGFSIDFGIDFDWKRGGLGQWNANCEDGDWVTVHHGLVVGSQRRFAVAHTVGCCGSLTLTVRTLGGGGGHGESV
jgi:hypothetical protein